MLESEEVGVIFGRRDLKGRMSPKLKLVGVEGESMGEVGADGPKLLDWRGRAGQRRTILERGPIHLERLGLVERVSRTSKGKDRPLKLTRRGSDEGVGRVVR